LPALAASVTVHVKVPPELLHAGLLAVRLVAMEPAPLATADPFTDARVMTMDRFVACVGALADGTETVNRAVVVDGAIAPGVATDALAGVVPE
jgi:hypothetical protein